MALAATTALLILLFRRSAEAADRKEPALMIDRGRGELRITGTIHPTAMSRPFGVKGHHAVVWRGGRASRWALIRSDASDQEVRAGLRALGSKAGENLTAEAWLERNDPASRTPDVRVDGTTVAVGVQWSGSGQPKRLDEVVRSTKPGASGNLDFRHGGNERFRKQFRSGCIVCLHSCPGGVIGNSRATMRDLARDVLFYPIENALPPDGTRVTVIIKTETEEK